MPKSFRITTFDKSGIIYLYESMLWQIDCNDWFCNIFFDFDKTFDCVAKHQILLNKLEH